MTSEHVKTSKYIKGLQSIYQEMVESIQNLSMEEVSKEALELGESLKGSLKEISMLILSLDQQLDEVEKR